VLKLLDRQHTPGRAGQAAQEAREAGFEHVNLDLIYGTPGESVAEFLSALEKNPHDPDSWHHLALAHRQQGDILQVRKCLNKALEIDPTLARAWYALATLDFEAGNFDIAASLGHCFATGSHKNGAASNSFTPTLIGAYAFHRFDVISSIGGTLPTSKTDTQGRSIAWTALAQAHATRHVWFEVENNATYYIGGARDGKMQNFVTPAAFYVVRPKEWKPAHPYFIIDVGMQIATSSFHTYNHNLISETRIIF